ncbi:MAG: hypothetical protein CMK06_02395 [Ponticaulis sp.]|nr:hypothetical protein [Ponticaulis sp.]
MCFVVGGSDPGTRANGIFGPRGRTLKMKTALIASLIGATLISPAAFAGDNFKVEFAYDKEELATAEGTEALYKRLRSHIREACNLTSQRRGLKVQQLENQCVSDATETALSSISSSTLTAYHQERTGSAVG